MITIFIPRLPYLFHPECSQFYVQQNKKWGIAIWSNSNLKTFSIMPILIVSFINKKCSQIFILLIILLSVSNLLWGQTCSKELSLENQSGIGPFRGTSYKVTIKDSSNIAKNIPDFIEDYIIKHFGFTTSKHVEMNFYFLIGKNISGDTILIYDKNHDFDFTNDTIYSFKASTLLYNENSITLNFYDSIPRFFKIRPILYKTNFNYFNRVEQEKYLMIAPDEHLKAIFTFNNINYSIYIYPFNGTPDYKNDDGSKIMIGNKDTLIELKIGDPQKIDGFVVNPICISKYGDRLTLDISTIDQSQLITGNNTGFRLPKISLSDINNNKLAIPIKNKYTLLDFWGTWCKPCKELTPELKGIAAVKTNNLEIISIATYEKERNHVLKYIKDNEMNWHHIILNDKTTIPITIKYKVNEFPTFILINAEGIVIDRYVGPDGFKRLKIKLNELKLYKSS